MKFLGQWEKNIKNKTPSKYFEGNVLSVNSSFHASVELKVFVVNYDDVKFGKDPLIYFMFLEENEVWHNTDIDTSLSATWFLL